MLRGGGALAGFGLASTHVRNTMKVGSQPGGGCCFSGSKMAPRGVGTACPRLSGCPFIVIRIHMPRMFGLVDLEVQRTQALPYTH